MADAYIIGVRQVVSDREGERTEPLTFSTETLQADNPERRDVY
jgi:hypothetical protein